MSAIPPLARDWIDRINRFVSYPRLTVEAVTHPRSTIDAPLALGERGLSAKAIASRLSVPRGTIRDWSDGSRFMNTCRNWSQPRYAFSNFSPDIKRIFTDTCDLLGLRWTTSGRKTIYVSRKADVERMDEFIGPKA